MLTGEELKLEDVVKDTAKITKYLTEEEVDLAYYLNHNSYYLSDYPLVEKGNVLIDYVPALYGDAWSLNRGINVERYNDLINSSNVNFPLEKTIKIITDTERFDLNPEDGYNYTDIAYYNMNSKTYNDNLTNIRVQHNNRLVDEISNIINNRYAGLEKYLVKEEYEYHIYDDGKEITEMDILNKKFLDLIPEEWVNDSVYSTKEALAASLYMFTSLNYSIKDKLELYVITVYDEQKYERIFKYILKYNDKSIELDDSIFVEDFEKQF